MVSGRKPNQERRRQAARLRAGGLSLAEVGRRLGVCKQGAATLLRPLRQTPAVACAGCGAAIVSAGALPRDAGTGLCLPCLAGHPDAGLGQRLKAFRLAAGLLQKELARKAGVREPTIAAYEQARFRPRPTALARLARALGVPPEALEPGGPVPGK
jgi:transcriptional regulator with XRE-family HTH domain